MCHFKAISIPVVDLLPLPIARSMACYYESLRQPIRSIGRNWPLELDSTLSSFTVFRVFRKLLFHFHPRYPCHFFNFHPQQHCCVAMRRLNGSLSYKQCTSRYRNSFKFLFFIAERVLRGQDIGKWKHAMSSASLYLYEIVPKSTSYICSVQRACKIYWKPRENLFCPVWNPCVGQRVYIQGRYRFTVFK